MGAGGVGKSAITIRFINGGFADRYDPTSSCWGRKAGRARREKCVAADAVLSVPVLIPIVVHHSVAVRRPVAVGRPVRPRSCPRSCLPVRAPVCHPPPPRPPPRRSRPRVLPLGRYELCCTPLRTLRSPCGARPGTQFMCPRSSRSLLAPPVEDACACRPARAVCRAALAPDLPAPQGPRLLTRQIAQCSTSTASRACSRSLTPVSTRPPPAAALRAAARPGPGPARGAHARGTVLTLSSLPPRPCALDLLDPPNWGSPTLRHLGTAGIDQYISMNDLFIRHSGGFVLVFSCVVRGAGVARQAV